jgi:predicted metal-dependent RNase
LPEDETRDKISNLLPKQIIVSAVFCDEATGEVVLEVNKPEVIDAEMVIRLAQSTGWISHTRLSPHIPSTSISTMHSTLKASARERSNFLQELGKKIFRPPLLVRQRSTDNYASGGKYLDPNSKRVKKGNGISAYRHFSREEVMLFCLGGVKQVGRSCFIVMTPESRVMLDCGINPAESEPLNAFPRLDWFNFNFDELDAVVISHAPY